MVYYRYAKEKPLQMGPGFPPLGKGSTPENPQAQQAKKGCATLENAHLTPPQNEVTRKTGTASARGATPAPRTSCKQMTELYAKQESAPLTPEGGSLIPQPTPRRQPTFFGNLKRS
jgi:hypothetical protein